MQKIKIPKDFLWGCAISEYQNSGAGNCPDSNWAAWEAGRKNNGKSNIRHGHCSGISCDYKNNALSDIALIKDLGLNAIRFSVEWSKVESREGNFDENVLNFYSTYVDELIKNNINPLITIFHFTLPNWFEQLGGFEKEENIIYFVRFAKKVFEILGSKVNLWCTINEPTIFVLQGYIRGVFPPGKSDAKLGLTVLKNLMKAHVDIYKNLKVMPNGQNALISFAHQYLEFNPYHRYNPLERLVSKSLNYFLNRIIFRFCATGIFKIDIPLLYKIEFNAGTNKIIDYFGLNYYSRVLLKFQLDYKRPFLSCSYPEEIMTDMPYAIYPKGLYDAIKKCSKLRLPIYITENGVADSFDDRREIFLKQYLASLNKAISEGIDVRGYYYWTLMDNFEWDEGFTMKFGLYKVNFETQERTLRDGALFFKKIIKH